VSAPTGGDEAIEGEPASLRLGVTGHRDLVDGVEVGVQIDRAIDDLLVPRPAGALVELRSSLAEGADRVAAERVLARAGGRLVVILPLEADEYRRDFLTPDSLAEFDGLLERAAAVSVTGPDGTGSRESAYERAGRAVVDGSDVLVACWDGQPAQGQGGTAEVIEYARASGRPVVIVPVRRRRHEDARS
jgi:hypothetical protein